MAESTLAIKHQNHQLELQNLWFLSRSSGDYDQARWLRSQLKPYSDDESTLDSVRSSLIESIEYWEKSYQRGTVSANMRLEQSEARLKKKEREKQPVSPSNLVRVAPAAIEIDGETGVSGPRLGNTGGTYATGELTTRLSAYEAAEDTVKLHGNKSSITKVDWLSVSFPYVVGEDEQRTLWAVLSDFMDRAHIEISVRGKGHHGYTDSASLSIVKEKGSSRNVGMLAWSEKQGYFMELSGVGCDYAMKHLSDLYVLISVYAGRISRLDIALDLHSEYCIDNGLTVPKFSKQVSDGVFRSAFTPTHVAQRISRGGDWDAFIHGDITADTYDPTKHAAEGLTVYAGSNKSDNQIVFYEKGKQLLGALSDKDAEEFRYLLGRPERSEEGQERFTHLCDKYELEPERCSERAWVRVERRLRRGANKKFISPDMLLDPDSAFCHTMDGLTDLFQGYSQHVKQAYTDIKSFRRVSAERLEVMSLSKKLFYARQNVGALICTLQDLDYSAEQIVGELSSELPLKDIIFDLLE